MVSFSVGRPPVVVSHRPQSQDDILVDKSGSARLNDFGFTGIASLNCTWTSAAGFKGSLRWVAPELFKIDDNAWRSGLSTNATDVFALGMVTFEVGNTCHERRFQCL